MKKIDDPYEVQFRQAHPAWVEDGRPTRQIFLPTKKDAGQLSLDRSHSTTPEQCYSNFQSLGLASSGVFGLTPEEFSEGPHPLDCFASPAPNNPHHSHADFTGLTHGQQKAKSIMLLKHAIARGKLHP